MQPAAIITALAGLAVGFVLGLACFGGLWWTTRRLVTSRQPAGLMLASFVVRMGLLGVGLAGVARLGLPALLAATAGLLLARHLMIRCVQAEPAKVL